MEILIKASQFILSLSLLIVLHELGHFIPAKIFKTKVEKFYLFFDYKFSILKKKVGETVYGIGWIPLGGYVKISGMIDESMDTEQMKQEPQPWEFRSKPAWQRLIIMLGGVIVNFILGIFIYIMLMYTYGEKYLPNDNVKDGIWVQESDSLAINLGLKTGDKILTVDGQKLKKFSDITLAFINGNNYTIEREGEILNRELPVDFIDKLITRGKDAGAIVSPRYPFMISDVPDDSQNKDAGIQSKDIIVNVNGLAVTYYDEIIDAFQQYKNQNITVSVKRGEEIVAIPVLISDEGKIGAFATDLKMSELERMGYYERADISYTFAESIPAGFNKSYETLANYVKQLKKIFNPKTGAYKGLGGFISIANIFPPEWNWQVFWNMTALLSIMLGFMNLLPIPALDGGHVVFTLWEMITGRKPNDKFLEYAQVTGFIILIALLLFANGNDIVRLFD